MVDRQSTNIYHFHFFNIGDLHRYERKGYSVVVHVLFPLKYSYMNDTLALLAPEFIFDANAPRDNATHVFRCQPSDVKLNGDIVDFVTDPDFQRWCAVDDEVLPPVHEGCELATGAVTVEREGKMDRVDPASHIYFRELMMRKLVDRLGPLRSRPLDDKALYYILRRTKGVRQIVNEDVIRPPLEAMGFQFIELEHLPVFEKLRVFATARVIISPQSAGLTFAAVMDQRALLIEVFPKDSAQPMRQFDHLTRDVGVPYVRYDACDYIENQGFMKGWYGVFDMKIQSTSHFLEFVAEKIRSSAAVAHQTEWTTSPVPAPSLSPTPYRAWEKTSNSAQPKR
jgi:hypothetical protein